jgi:hypothetical protein
MQAVTLHIAQYVVEMLGIGKLYMYSIMMTYTHCIQRDCKMKDTTSNASYSNIVTQLEACT